MSTHATSTVAVNESDRNSFIQVAPDCPATHGIVPVSNRETKPIHVIQFELLSQNPYKYTFEDLLFEVYVRRSGLSEGELHLHGDDLRRSLLQKEHPCLRASLLPKKYGWGVHANGEGKLAIWGRESEEYRRFTQSESGTLKLTTALRNKRR